MSFRFRPSDFWCVASFEAAKAQLLQEMRVEKAQCCTVDPFHIWSVSELTFGIPAPQWCFRADLWNMVKHCLQSFFWGSRHNHTVICTGPCWQLDRQGRRSHQVVCMYPVGTLWFSMFAAISSALKCSLFMMLWVRKAFDFPTDISFSEGTQGYGFGRIKSLLFRGAMAWPCWEKMACFRMMTSEAGCQIQIALASESAWFSQVGQGCMLGNRIERQSLLLLLQLRTDTCARCPLGYWLIAFKVILKVLFMWCSVLFWYWDWCCM